MAQVRIKSVPGSEKDTPGGKVMRAYRLKIRQLCRFDRDADLSPQLLGSTQRNGHLSTVPSRLMTGVKAHLPGTGPLRTNIVMASNSFSRT